MSSLAVSGLSFTQFNIPSGKKIITYWTVPTSTAGIEHFYAKWINGESEIVRSQNLTLTTTADEAYNSSFNFPDGNYIYSIDSRTSPDYDVLGTSPVYTLSISANVVVGIIDVNGYSISINTGGGGGGASNIVTNVSFGWVSSTNLFVNWDVPSSTIEMLSIRIMIIDETTTETMGDGSVSSTTTAYPIYNNDKGTGLPSGTYTINIESISFEYTVLASVQYTMTVASNTVTQITKNGIAVSITQFIDGDGGGGGGGGGGEAFISNSIVYGSVGANSLWINAGHTIPTGTQSQPQLAIGSCIQTSTDGITWTSRSNELTMGYCVAFGKTALAGSTIIVAVGNGGIINSSDGLTWNRVLSITGYFYSVEYGGGRWNAVGQAETAIIYTSLNGTEWTNATLDNAQNELQIGLFSDFQTVSFNVTTGLWVAGGTSTVASMIKSTDGINWLQIDPDQSGDVFYSGIGGGGGVSSIANSESLWVAGGTSFTNDGNNTRYSISTSTNGTSWTKQVCPLTKVNALRLGIFQGAPLWVAIGSIAVSESVTSFSVATSTNGTSWTSIEFTNTFQPTSIGFGDNKWILGGNDETLANTLVYLVNPLSHDTWTYGLIGSEIVETSAIPPAPTNITVIPSAASALVSWNAPSSNPAITSYKIYCVPDNKLANLAEANATSLNVTGLKNGTSYIFSVIATNSLGSSYTTTCIPSTLPGVPKVGVVGGNGQATVSWVSKAAVGSPTTGYTLTCNQTGVTLPQTPTSPVLITGLTNGTSYIFSVTATNLIGTSAAGASKAVIPTSRPGVPINVVATGGTARLTVSWEAPVTNGGLAITEYNITYVGGGKTVIAKVKPTIPLPYTLTVLKLTPGSYSVTALAKNKLGASDASQAITITVT